MKMPLSTNMCQMSHVDILRYAISSRTDASIGLFLLPFHMAKRYSNIAWYVVSWIIIFAIVAGKKLNAKKHKKYQVIQA